MHDDQERTGGEHPARALFRVAPSAYVDERTRLVAAARAAGDRALAAELKSLKRPTLSMWAVVAAAADRDLVLELAETTERLAEVQRQGDRSALFRVDTRRRTALKAVVNAAFDALRTWETPAVARRGEMQTIADQLSRHADQIQPWIDGTLRELPDTDGFGFAAFSGMEPVQPRAERTPSADPPRGDPDHPSHDDTGGLTRRLRSVPPLPADETDGDGRSDHDDRLERPDGSSGAGATGSSPPSGRLRTAAERRETRLARAALVAQIREARREAAVLRKESEVASRRALHAETAYLAAQEASRLAAEESDQAVRRRLEADERVRQLEIDLTALEGAD